MEKTRGGLNTKIHLAVDAHGLPVWISLTKGVTADCTQAIGLIEGLSADTFTAARSYDTNTILEWLKKHGIEAVIPPKKNRMQQRDYDKYTQHWLMNLAYNMKRYVYLIKNKPAHTT